MVTVTTLWADQLQHVGRIWSGGDHGYDGSWWIMGMVVLGLTPCP